MTVDVTPLNILGAGGAAPVFSFADNFNRGDGGLGKNWATGTYGIAPPVTAPLGIPTTAIFTLQMFTAYNGTNNPNTVGVNFAIPIIDGLYQNLYGKSQFCQFTFASFATTASIGLGVCLSADQETGYIAIAGYSVGPSQFITLYRLTNGGTPFIGTFTALAAVRAAGAAGGFQTGEVWRINVNQNGAFPVIQVLLNGVVQTTFTDNVNPLRLGSPGLIHGPFNLFTQTGNVAIDNFSCGIGL